MTGRELYDGFRDEALSAADLPRQPTWDELHPRMRMVWERYAANLSDDFREEVLSDIDHGA